ncbi:tetratricopeptide repeat protein [Lyngbya aestuarii]|uniref:tetratricopeptide repeat protein n=1 Tax=Lyngbya aestuarii TaxID=118322 RepID=UPI00403D8428
MIDEVAHALECQDYRTAARLLKQLLKQEPQNPWVKLYLGRFQEDTGKLETAQKVYRQLLQNTTNPKVMSQARQGLERLAAREQKQRQEALTQATADPSNRQLGVLILEPISASAKQVAAQQLARIMQIDPYTARLQLPTRGWRLYRTGPVGELEFYASSLQQESIPCFWAALADIQKISVFGVDYFSEGDHRITNSTTSQAAVICRNTQGQKGSLTFNWSEVTQRVEGLLPLFEEVVDLDVRRKLTRKTQTLDYVQFCDLHLPQRSTILRFCDRQYQFQQGIAFTTKQKNSENSQLAESTLRQGTTRLNWNNLLDFLNHRLPQLPVWSDFTNFAEAAVDYREMLRRLPSHIDLFRREETPWDSAFQLYSGLIFLKNASEK